MTEEFSKVMKFTQDCGMLSCDAVIVSCSGGPDSMALLDILDTYRNDINSRMMLYCIHVNHNLKGRVTALTTAILLQTLQREKYSACCEEL